MAAGATCFVAIVMMLSALLSASSRLGAQVLRNPETPYHFLRYDDVPSDQNSPYWPKDFWSPLKFIPLDIAPGSYINFGGGDRERVEHFSNPFFGLTPRGNTTYDLHRLLFEGDLHIGDTFRTFIQFGNHLATAPSTSPPTDVDRLDLQQGFADLRAPIGQDGSVTFRGGRHEMLFGSARLVDVREGPNVRLSFDGGRAFYQSPDIRVDTFLVRPVVPEPGVFDDHSDPGQAFWGLYSVMPVRPVPGLNADLYYLGLDRRNAAFDSGVANQTVHSLGCFGARPAPGTIIPRAYYSSEVSAHGISGPGLSPPILGTQSAASGANHASVFRLMPQAVAAPAEPSRISIRYSQNTPISPRRRSTRQSTWLTCPVARQ
jgi:alginate export protein